jgi:hypothetical protein
MKKREITKSAFHLLNLNSHKFILYLCIDYQ